VELKGVPLGKCAAEVGRIYAGAAVHKFDLVDVTIGPEGKVIIVFEKDTMTKDGKTYILPQFTRFIFNDDGIMIGYMVIFNPGLLRDAPATQQELIGFSSDAPVAGTPTISVFLAFSLGCAITALLMMNYRTVKPEPLLG
jgi:hypothetical protein